MSELSQAFRPRTVAGQLTGVVVGAVLLGVVLASAVMLYLVYSGGVGPSRDTMVQIRAARIAAIVNGVLEARSLNDANYVAKHANSDPVHVAWAALPKPQTSDGAPRNKMVADIEQDLHQGWRLETVPHDRTGKDGDTIFVKVGDNEALRFTVAPYGGLGSLVLAQTLCTLAVITFILLFVSTYAVRWITAPLTSIASAARAFGRPGGEAADLDETGPIEISQAARALNDMRKRVRSLVDERTRMLVAVSHDLRTPLTRLRLRIDRLSDGPAKVAMLDEIATINEMLTETLAYMREVGQSEASVATDLPSLAQTIAAQFADAGSHVTYRGPDRLALACRPHALTRAIGNLVDNAVKFGGHVEIGVQQRGGEVWIEVSDDGPGIPDRMLAHVFEPYFKGDDARAQAGGGGFGLGLSIVREIAAGHGGDVELENVSPHGLMARLRLPLSGALASAAA
jgi:signal transduction histidine kinase